MPEIIAYDCNGKLIKKVYPLTDKKIIAFDFDGTLVENKYPWIGQVRIQYVEMAKLHKKDGDKIILWTCREGDMLTAAVNFCKDKLGLEFDAVNDNLPENIELFGNNCRKIFADVYVDDRAMHAF